MRNNEKNWYNQVVDAYTSEQRRNWYSEVANAYNRVRPRYSQALINRVVELAQLPKDASILEVGCGPGTATTSFAQLGYAMVCLEPSGESYQLARQNCAQYPNVEIANTTFEEWELEPERFNAVLAATSFHWVSPDIAYAKAADALHDKGYLILLWNMTPQVKYEVYQVLHQVYQTHVPSLGKYETEATQEEQIRKFGQGVLDSGRFSGLVSEQFACEATYSIEDYLTLLGTLSPYIMLESQQRDALFAGLRDALERTCSKTIQVSYLSAFHIAQKI